MGNVESGLDDSIADAKRVLAEASDNFTGAKANREKGWKATGIVALRDSNLKELPDSVLALQGTVKVIDATNNRIPSLPASITQLVGLQRLVLAQNRLTELPPALCTIAGLKILILDSNRLEKLPDDFGSLLKLEKLSLASNALSALPDSIRTLRALRNLNLAGNRLTALPASLGGCTELEEVDASGNCVASLSPDLGQLKRLRTLQLDGNRLEAVPSEILVGCTALQTLSLHENPIKRETLTASPGWAGMEARLRDKNGKRVAGGVLLGSRGLDDGLDAKEAKIIVPHA